MTDRAPMHGDVPAVCPLVGLDDDAERHAPVPARRHRCYAEDPPAPRALAHQQAYCLTEEHPACPFYQDYVDRQRRSAGLRAFSSPAAALAGRPAQDVPAIAGARRQPEREPVVSAVGGGAGEGVPVIRGQSAPGDRALASHNDDPTRYPPRRPQDPAAGGYGSAADRGYTGPPAQDPRGRGGYAGGDPGRPPGGVEGDYDRTAIRNYQRTRPPGPGPEDSYADPRPPTPSDTEAELPPFLAARGGGGAASPTPDPATLVDDDAAAPSAEAGVRSGDVGRGGASRRPDRGGPGWERPRRLEAYPRLRTRMSSQGMPRIALAIGAAILALALLLLVVPGFLGGGGGRSPSASAGQGGGVASSSPRSTDDAGGSPRASRSPRASGGGGPRASESPRRGGGEAEVYVVRRGDTLARIAERFGVTVQRLLRANPEIRNPNQIEVGDEIRIPRRRAEASP